MSIRILNRVKREITRNYFSLFLTAVCILSACQNFNNTTINGKGDIVTLENKYLALDFNCFNGTYSITDKKSGYKALSDVKLKINEWSSGDIKSEMKWEKSNISDDFGEGMALDLIFENEDSPSLKFTFKLYDNHGFINATGGINNTTGKSIQVKEIFLVSDAQVYEGIDVTENFAMVDGFSGGEPLEYGSRMYSPLTRSNALKSRNNILLTFTEEKDRETMVLGGLTYSDFEKFATIEQPRKIELEKGADGIESLLCYLNLPAEKFDQNVNQESLQMVKGEELQTWHYHEFRCTELATSVKSPGQIEIEARNIDPSKSYVLGFSWWNGYWHGNHEDNYQSVFIEFIEEGNTKRIPLLKNKILPRFDGREKKDVEQVEMKLPGDAVKASEFKIIITKGDETESDKNVYLSEVWLRDGKGENLLPEELTPVGECPRPRVKYSAQLFARDPVGKKVDPGEKYYPSDNFYIDITNTDPFIALEEYGKRVAIAQQIELSMYDFPTVCLWYAENDYYGKSNAENTTMGAVNEMRYIKESGFLNYSRAAVRLVPDSYMPDNQQGWWDDDHWQQECEAHGGSKNGIYVQPYETSEKWGKAINELGGIPLTYFQTSYRSEDYAKQFPGHMLFNKTYAWKGKEEDTEGEIFTNWEKTWTRNGRVVWGYDYTDPQFLDHLTGVYQNLKKGNIKGLMFDYPSSGWAEKGGMEDEYSTTAAAYRNIFRYAHEGLGSGAYVHERNMIRGSDVTIGCVASMRTENDTDMMDSTTVTRCGMRWYKNRVLINQDTDSKNLIKLEDNEHRDNVRAVLTMAYVVTGRLLLANSFSQFTSEMFWDLSRTFPYHTENKSARPVDAFVSPSPMVYDFDVNEQWHQVTFFNPDKENSRKVGISISGVPVDGALGLDENKSYYVYDFWNDKLIGKYTGSMRLEQKLRAGEARMMSVRECVDHPQLLSTNRHIMQGYLDVVGIDWNPETKTLNGISRIVSDDPYILIIAANGFEEAGFDCADGRTKAEVLSDSGELLRLSLLSPENGEVKWSVKFK